MYVDICTVITAFREDFDTVLVSVFDTITGDYYIVPTRDTHTTIVGSTDPVTYNCYVRTLTKANCTKTNVLEYVIVTYSTIDSIHMYAKSINTEFTCVMHMVVGEGEVRLWLIYMLT